MSSSLFPKRSNSQNPMLEKAKAMMNTPMINTVRGIVGNRDPQEVFYELCRQKGINPDEILKLLR